MSGNNKRSLRRIATGLAAVGALVLSSGVALLVVGASPANAAADKYFVCKFVGTPGVDEVLQGGGNPISVPAAAIPTDPIVFGAFFADAQGRSFVLAEDNGQDVDVSDCLPAEPEPELTVASVTFVDPSCENDNVASYQTSGDNVTFSVEGNVAPEAKITVTALADEGYIFAGDQTSLEFDHTFATEELDCEVVVDPPGEEPVDPDPIVEVAGPEVPEAQVTPTVVSAGFAPAAGADLTGQAAALLGAGLVLLVAAGGLARQARIRS